MTSTLQYMARATLAEVRRTMHEPHDAATTALVRELQEESRQWLLPESLFADAPESPNYQQPEQPLHAS